MLEKLNYKKNININPGEGTLNGQGCGNLALCRYGFFPMSYNGCEIIAVYNFLYLQGRAVPLCEIAKEIYPYGNFLSGLFGTFPRAAGRYFRENNIPVNKEKKYEKFRDEFASRRLAVITFWNARHIFKGIHTVCIENVPEGIKVYNIRNKTAHPVVLDSLDNYMDAHRFICGYYA